MKAIITVLDCPNCRKKIPAYDYDESGLSQAECPYFGEKFEIRELMEGLEPIVKPKKVS